MTRPPTVRRPSAQIAWARLAARSAEVGMDCVCSRVLEDRLWCEAPASAGTHHCRESGLLEHTDEVVELAWSAANAADQQLGPDCDRRVLVVAGIYHDLLKTRDYHWEVKPDGRIAVGHKPYHNLIHHISGSYAEFMRVCSQLTPAQLGLQSYKQKRHWEDAVGHAILAHHGRLEWHSPVTPQTKEAIILHHADSLSANADAQDRSSERWTKDSNASHQ